MRAIIISEADARGLVDRLKLRALQDDAIMRDDPSRPPTMADVHRAFHYVVMSWLEEQGVDVGKL